MNFMSSPYIRALIYTLYIATISCIMFLYIFGVYFSYSPTRGYIHSYILVVLFFYVSTMICGVIVISRKNTSFIFLLVSAVLAVFFWISLRAISFNAADGELFDVWPLYTNHRIAIDEINNEEYCYRLTSFYIEIQPQKHGQSIRLFRGVWPSYFPSKSVDDGFLGIIKVCRHDV